MFPPGCPRPANGHRSSRSKDLNKNGEKDCKFLSKKIPTVTIFYIQSYLIWIILILYLSSLIIAYYIALIVFKIKTSNFLYVFMYLLFTSQTHPLCLKSLLVSLNLFKKKRSRTAQQRTLTSSGVAMVLDVSDIWFYAFHVRWRHVDAHHVASRVKVTRKTEAFQAGIMPYDRKWWHGFPWSSLNPFRSFTQSRSIQLNPLCLAYDLEQIGICRLWGARGARPEIVTGSAFTIWMDFWIGVRWLWWILWMW